MNLTYFPEVMAVYGKRDSQAIHLLQSKRQNKCQAGLVYPFLNTAVQPHPDHFDTILIGLHVNQEELIADNQQHYDDQDLQSKSQLECFQLSLMTVNVGPDFSNGSLAMGTCSF